MRLLPSARPRQGLLAVTILAAALTLSACSRSETKRPTSSVEIQDFLARITTAMEELLSVHVEIETVVKYRERETLPLWLSYAEADIELGGDFLSKGRTERDGQVIESGEQRNVDGKVYRRESELAPWAVEDREVPEGTNSFLIESFPLFVKVLDPTILSIDFDDRDGEEVFRITAGNAGGIRSDYLRVWVGIEDLLIRESRSEKPATRGSVISTTGKALLSEEEADDAVMTNVWRFSHFNEPVEVEAPEVVTPNEE